MLEQKTVGFHFVGKVPMVEAIAFVLRFEASFNGGIDGSWWINPVPQG
jgi:hypothetical protein